MIFKRKALLLLLIIVLAAILRIPFLSFFPPSLYSDEVNQGYNAYSILKTGRDEHGKFLPISLRSFGDWKPPMQTYLMVPMIAVFGLNEWGVRLPSAIFGTLTVLLIYFLVVEIMNLGDRGRGNKENKEDLGKEVALLSAALLAISPWHIHHSRMAMLTVIALFFLTFGVFGFLKGIKKSVWFVISAAFFSLAIYSYYGMRLLVPLFLVFLAVYFRREISWKSRGVVWGIGIGIIFLAPLGFSFFKNPDVVFGRAKTVSVFYDKGVELLLWERIAQEGSKVSPLIARFFHNKPTLYTLSIARRFFSHLDGEFLFLVGDQHLPFQLPNMGVIYLIDGIFLLIGFLYSIRNRQKKRYGVIFFWFIVSIFPAALTFLTPSANRSFNMVVPEVVLVSYGIYTVVKRSKKYRKAVAKLVIGGYILSLSFFFYQYVIVLPKSYTDWWHFGYKEVISYLEQEKENFEEIVMPGNLSMPYIYVSFFNQYEPQIFWKSIRRDLKPDEFGFEHVSSLGKFWFPRHFSWEKDSAKFSKSTLVVTLPEENVEEAELKKIIYYPDKKEAYRIYSIISDEK